MREIKELHSQEPTKFHKNIIQPMTTDEDWDGDTDLIDVLDDMEIAQDDELYADISDWFAQLA